MKFLSVPIWITGLQELPQDVTFVNRLLIVHEPIKL